ncbi:hypothetical protein PENSPDRAFT_460417 [Peniophora sp. CONT]|nr:hypothetical protein PENSPDRAFT_460417 [Peniophora sp. CONT]
MSSPQSPPTAFRRPSMTSQVAALGNRLARSLSRDSTNSSNAGVPSTVAPNATESGGVVSYLRRVAVPIFARAESLISALVSPERRDGSLQRGREVRSSGRGGAGNIRPSSSSPAQRGVGGPDDFSVTRGRELLPQVLTEGGIMSTGRGGAGNIISRSKDRSVSRDESESVVDTIVSTGEAEYERHLIREHAAARAAGKFPSGRGGAGNVQRAPA